MVDANMWLYFDDKGNIADSNLLFKIGKLKHLEELQNGSLYMNKLSSFRKYETEGMGDKEEGLFTRFTEGILYVNGIEIGEVKNGETFLFDNAPVFCLASVPLQKVGEKNYEYVISREMLEDFMQDDGEEYGILLIRKDFFVEKIKNVLDESGDAWYWDKVNYSDERPSFPKNESYKIAFQKRMKFSHQNEWRLVLYIDIDDFYRLEIGSLEGGSFLKPIKSIDDDIKIEYLIKEKRNDG